MWKQVFKLARQLITLAESTERNRTRIQELQVQVENLTLIVHSLVHEIRRNSENEAHEREKLVLRLENELLRFERRLPGGKK